MGNNKSTLNTQNEEYQGRKYLNEENSYTPPNNFTEIDLQQEIYYHFKLIFDENYSAPVREYLENGCKVLDLGCGIGIWVCELATKFPNSNFMGVDMMPVYPSEIKPVNAEFVKSNILKGLPFKDNEFDYVHTAQMNTYFKNEEWINKVVSKLNKFIKVIPELVRVTKPRGWIEFCEADTCLIDAGPNSTRLFNGLSQSLFNLGINPRCITLMKKWLQSRSDIMNITESTKLIPLGVWDSAIGKHNFMLYLNYVKLRKPRIINGLNISEDECSKLMELTYAEFSSTEYEGKFTVTRIFGQKFNNQIK
ncbi:hypothetical protein Glove_115g23 [Diversispora epigaea]|uniref:Methyltransferase domain-containing protein n=1 Tax=Diversispora epigaea TaxID=1348612 RepID=A0A397J7H1_9GLOM|nr:hypothetical protein Glove_115g23 [Diversispora epigaea]